MYFPKIYILRSFKEQEKTLWTTSLKKTKQTLWPLFMDGVQLPQG